MRQKKILTILLTLVMVLGLLPQTAFAAGNTATTMRLAKTQGTVAVTNATGKKVPQTASMKLYSGYKLKTGAKSYAWISLDNTKVAKLDANSVVSVQKTGQKLTLYLSSGNLFFNVKDPLKSGESFQIKTSTMTTGIRGTSGCVRVISPRVTEIHLLTGQVEVYTENPEMGVSKTAILKAGQKAYSLIAEDAMAATGEQADILIERLDGSEVCGNCSKEIAADPALVERIKKEAPHLLPDEIAAEADERLAADEAAAEEKQAEIDEAVANQEFPEEVDPLFEEKSSGGGGGGGSSSSTTETETTIKVSNWDEFVAAVDTFNNGSKDLTIQLTADIVANDTSTTGDETPAITNTANSLTLHLDTYDLQLPSALENNTNLTITNADGSISALDEFSLRGEVSNLIINHAGATLTLKDGDLTLQNNFVGVQNDGTFIMNGGSIITADVDGETVAFGDAVMNRGTFTMNGGEIKAFDGGIGVENSEDGTVTINNGTISNEILNYGTMTINGGTWTDNAAIIDSSTIQNYGKMDITGGTFNYSGKSALMEGSISIASGAELNITGGTFNDEGVLIGNKGGTFNMTGGTLTVSATSATRDIEAYYDDAGGTATIGGDAKIIIDVSGVGNSMVLTQLNAIQLASASAELTMTGGTIEVNGLNSGSDVCGVRTKGTFEMTDGTIKVNKGGYGVYCDDGEIKLTGGSIAATSASAYALYVPDESVIASGYLGTTLTATLMDNVMGDVRPTGYRIVQKNGVYTPEDMATTGYSAATKDELDAIFEDIQVTYKSNGTATATIFLKGNIDYGTDTLTIEKGMDVNLDVGAYTLTVNEPIQNAGTLSINSTEGGVVKTAAALPLVYNTGTLELQGAALNVTSTIMSSSNPMAVVYTTGDFVMERGTISMDLTTGTNFADVIVDGGTFTMNGGNIETAAASKASGIIVKNDGECTLNTGTLNVNAANGYGVHNVSGTVNLSSTGTTEDTRSRINVTTENAYGVYNEDAGTLTADNGYVNVTGKNSVGILNGTNDITLAGIRVGASAAGAVGIRSTGGVTIPRHYISASSGGVGIELLGGTSRIGDTGSKYDYDTSSLTETRLFVNDNSVGIHLKNDAALTFKNYIYVEKYTGLGIQVDSGAA